MKPHDTPVAGWVHTLLTEYRLGRPLVLLFDFDGTLTPIVRHPSLAFLPAPTRAVLAGLAALPEVEVGVLSGRPLHELKSLVGFDGFYYAGSGGLEMDLRGERRVFPAADSFEEVLVAVHERLLETLRRFPGTWVERKPVALSVHFRGLLPLAAVCFRLEVSTLLAAMPQLRSRVVSEAIEVTPAGGWDKGTAVDAVLDGLRGTRLRPLPVYFGDSPNDFEGMLATTAAGGLTVGVGEDAPDVAAFRLPDTNQLAGELTDLYRALAAVRGMPLPPEPTPEPVRPEGPPDDASTGLIVVDPDPAHRERLSSGMRRFGWRVWAFASPDEADRALNERAAEVRAVIVDLDQSGLAGGQLLGKWGREHPAVVRCGMSGVSPVMALAFRRVSGLPLLTKPVDPDESNLQLRQLVHAPGIEHSG